MNPLAALLALLGHDDPWIRMNASYAIGEADPAGLHGEQVGALLDEPLDAVVRVAIDTICCQDACGPDVVRRLHRLLTDDVVVWPAARDRRRRGAGRGLGRRHGVHPPPWPARA